MGVDNRIEVQVWERTADGTQWAFRSSIDAWTTLSFERRHNQPGAWSLTTVLDDQTRYVTRQHLLTFDFRGERVTGVVEHIGPRSDGADGVVLELSGLDALTLLGDAVCWPIPTAALSAQSTAHYTATGAAETVLTNLITANLVTRRGDNIAVVPSKGRGSSVTLNERFTNLLQVVTDKCEIAGLGVRTGLIQTTPTSTLAELTVWFYVPEDKSAYLTLSPDPEDGGTLESWAQSDDVPTATRAVVGGGGKGTSRVFRQITQTGPEASWLRKREVFVDARDTTDVPTLDERGTSELADAASQTSFEMVAADAEGTQLGVDFTVSDWLLVKLAEGLESVERLSAFAVTADTSGVAVTLTPGNPDVAPMFRTSAILRNLRQRIRNLEQEES